MTSRSIRCLNLSRTAVKKVPSSIEHYSQLAELKLKSCTSLQILPSNIGDMKGLMHLNLEGCSKLVTLPDSTCNLKSLEFHSIEDCLNLKQLPENIGNLESLKGISASNSGVRKLPSSINCLDNLDILNCNGCRDLKLPQFTGFPLLTKLFLGDCGLLGISATVGSLKSLCMLQLDGNDFEMLPETINQLSNLKYLYLNDNVRLKYIPELPLKLEYLCARNCTSLESMPSFSEGNMDFSEWLDVSNCINLNQSMREKMMDDLLLRLETMLPQLRRLDRNQDRVSDIHEVLVCELAFDFSVPGKELPRRMKYKNEKGSNIVISMGQHDPLDFMVVAFSAVVTSSTDNKSDGILCESHFMTESRRVLALDCGPSFSLLKPLYGNRKPQNDELVNVVFWLRKVHFHEKQRFTKATFRFFVKRMDGDGRSNVIVNKCGVNLLSCDKVEIGPFFPFINTCGRLVTSFVPSEGLRSSFLEGGNHVQEFKCCGFN